MIVCSTSGQSVYVLISVSRTFQQEPSGNQIVETIHTTMSILF